MPPKKTIVISAPINPIKLATSKGSKGFRISSPTDLRWQPSTPMRDVMSRAQNINPENRIKNKFVDLLIAKYESNQSRQAIAQPVKNIEVVTSTIELKPRISKPVDRSLISRVAQTIGLRKKLDKNDIGAPMLQPLNFQLNASKELKAMMVNATTIATNNKLTTIGLSRINEEMEQYKGKGSNNIDVSDVSSEENWSISSDSSFSNKYRTPKESNRKDEYIFVGSTIKKFSPVIAGPYPATTERLLTRVSVAKTPIQQPVFEQEKRLQKPIIPLKPLNLLAKSSHPLRPTQNNSLPEITGVKIALTPAPSSISRREIPQTPSTLTRSRIIKGVAVASTTSLIQSNEKSRNL